jgi:hypothetical protein
MNLIGKILVLLIVIMCIVFMGLALTVYSSHRNWKNEAENFEDKFNEKALQLNKAEAAFNRMESKLSGNLEAVQQQIRKLESERAMLVDRNVGIQAELDQLKQQSRDRIAAVAATQQNNDRLVKEVTGQRKELRDNQQARDKDFSVMLNATEAQDQTQGELNIVRAQNQAITRQVARMSKLLRANDIDPGLDPDFLMEPSDGIVSAVRRKGATQLIEVTIGADDGLQAGHTVEVFRGAKYLGRAEIISTSPDRAIGKLDRRFLRGQIQEGDRVATRLKLS